jgi:hypothetical protein
LEAPKSPGVVSEWEKFTKKIPNAHLVRWFTYIQWWFCMAKLNYQMVSG